MLLLAACQFDFTHAGTAVGNPTDLSVQLGAPSDVEVVAASVEVSGLSAKGCTEDSVFQSAGTTIDLLAPNAVVIPGGAWCGLTLHFGTPVHIEGTAEDVPYLLDLPLTEVDSPTTSAWGTDEGPFVLALGKDGWLTAREIEDDDAEETLAKELAREVDLYRDLDGDGTLSDDDERVGDDDEDQGQDQG